MEFLLYFKHVEPLHCVLNNTSLSEQYYQLIQQQWSLDQNAIFRDPQKYTLSYFKTLAHRASAELGWDWKREQYTIQDTVCLHKDIEQYLSQGFANIPEQYDELLHELHFALHAIESGSKRNSWLQIEWFNDCGFALSEDQYPAKLNIEFGDIRLQNPFVGHHPLFVYEQQDYHNIPQTCRLHNFVKPGINIVIQNETRYQKSFDWQAYVQWFDTHAADWLQQITVDTLKKYTGHPIVGRVKNLAALENAVRMPYLEFDRFEF
jgi:hypothetical protein